MAQYVIHRQRKNKLQRYVRISPVASSSPGKATLASVVPKALGITYPSCMQNLPITVAKKSLASWNKLMQHWRYAASGFSLPSSERLPIPSQRMSSPSSKRLCSRCHEYYDEYDPNNKCRFHPKSFVCRYHPEGERYYAAVEHNEAHRGWDGKCWCVSFDTRLSRRAFFAVKSSYHVRISAEFFALRYRECCGNEAKSAPGCVEGPHQPYEWKQKLPSPTIFFEFPRNFS